MRKGLDVYRRVQREATPDEATMGTLLRVLVDSILTGRRALAGHDFALCNKHLIAAQQVLLQLRSATPAPRDDVTENLHDLYAWCEISLGKANVSHDAELIDQVAAVLGNLRDGFEGAVSEGGQAG